MEDPEADRYEMGARLFDELAALRELHEREELTKARDALEEKDRQKDQFIAILAHELRNPLTAIRAAADALGLMKLEDPRVERLRERLDRQSMLMTRMLDESSRCRPPRLASMEHLSVIAEAMTQRLDEMLRA